MEIRKAFKLTLKTIRFLILFFGAITSAILSILTIISDTSASKACILGYKAHCSFTPFSTIILIFMLIVFCYICLKVYRKNVRNGD